MNPHDVVALGAEAWNLWRNENPSVLPDLRGASLCNLQLRGVRLRDTVLAGADLSFADLREADLSRADLRGVLLTGADLRNADLRSAVLGDLVGGLGSSIVDITDADFTGAVFGWTVVGDIYLNRISGIGRIRHIGPSYISTSTLEFTAREIQRTGAMRTDVESFLRDAGVLVDTFTQFREGLRSNAFYSAFISYSHVDKDFAVWLEDKLKRHRIRCWLDEKNMRPGDRILDAVAKAIGSHDRMLLCCSQSSLESWWVQDEVRKAQEIERQAEHELRILPLLLDNYLLVGWKNGLAADLRSRLGLDFSCFADKRGCEVQVNRLVQALSRAE